MTKTAPTLIDEIYRHTFDRDLCPGWKSNITVRHALESTRRFILDDRMSAFLADLSTAAFLRGANINGRIAESLRVSSRLPHENVWIEYSLHAYQNRLRELYDEHGEQPPVDDGIPTREGWLLQQHPTIDTACMMHIFLVESLKLKNPLKKRISQNDQLWTFPYAYAWTCDDGPLPWKLSIAREGRWRWHTSPVQGRYGEWKERRGETNAWASEIITGLYGHKIEEVGIVCSPLIVDPVNVHEQTKKADAYMSLLQEWVGIVRRVWALLSTIDHLPILKGDVRQSKGFLGQHRIRKFLDHQTITLNVPAKKDVHVLARQMIAKAHRKRHEVRGHWRDDWRNPPSKKCLIHLWEPVDNTSDTIRCSLCLGRQFYVHKHERGDASIGYVTHDYRVTHETEKGV